MYYTRICISSCIYTYGWAKSNVFRITACETDYIGRVRREMSFHYDLDGPAHLDPLSTGTGIYLWNDGNIEHKGIEQMKNLGN